MSAGIRVKNLKYNASVLKLYGQKITLGAMQQVNLTTSKVTTESRKTARASIKHRGKSHGQWTAGIRAKFAKPSDKRIIGEAKSMAPHGSFLEMGTGRRGRGTAKGRLTGYRHGSKPGMDAKNIFFNAKKKFSKYHREAMAKVLNKENPTRPGARQGQ